MTHTITKTPLQSLFPVLNDRGVTFASVTALALSHSVLVVGCSDGACIVHQRERQEDEDATRLIEGRGASITCIQLDKSSLFHSMLLGDANGDVNLFGGDHIGLERIQGQAAASICDVQCSQDFANNHYVVIATLNGRIMCYNGLLSSIIWSFDWPECESEPESSSKYSNALAHTSMCCTVLNGRPSVVCVREGTIQTLCLVSGRVVWRSGDDRNKDRIHYTCVCSIGTSNTDRGEGEGSVVLGSINGGLYRLHFDLASGYSVQRVYSIQYSVRSVYSVVQDEWTAVVVCSESSEIIVLKIGDQIRSRSSDCVVSTVTLKTPDSRWPLNVSACIYSDSGAHTCADDGLEIMWSSGGDIYIAQIHTFS